MGRAGRAIAAFMLALAGLVTVTTPVAAQPSTDGIEYRAAAQSIPCSSLNVLRRELLSLSRTSDMAWVPTLLDSVVRRMGVIVPRVPRVPGSTLAVLLVNLQEQQAELAGDGLSDGLLARIRDTASTSYGLFAFVNCT